MVICQVITVETICNDKDNSLKTDKNKVTATQQNVIALKLISNGNLIYVNIYEVGTIGEVSLTPWLRAEG